MPPISLEHLTTEQFARSHWAINTTTKCQQRCIYCFEGDRTDKTDLDLDEVKRILDDASAEVPLVMLMGAEPTMNRDLKAIVAYGTELGLVVGVSTNGLKLSKIDYLEGLVDAGLRGIEMSFPYQDASTYGVISRRPERDFKRLLDGLANIDRVNEGSSQPLFVNINVVVSRFNVAQLGEVLSILDERLSHTAATVTFKWVSPSSDKPGAEPDYLERFHVPTAVLRSQFVSLLSDWRYDLGPIFRSFPRDH